MKIKNFKFSTKEIALVAVLFFLAAFFRFYNLNELPVFVDEAIYVRWAQVMRVETTLRFLPLSDGKQPLFMWVVIPFMKVINDPLIAGRAVSALSGLLTLSGVFVAGYLLFNSKKISILAGLIYVLSPYAVFFDRMALVDSMLTMFGIWFFIFMIIAIRKIRLDFAMLAGFALGGALLTKSPALYFVLLLPTTILVADITKKNYKVKFIKILLLWMTALIIGYVMFNILRLGPNFHMLSARNFDYVHPFSHIFSNPLDPFIPHLKAYVEYLWILGPASFILLFIGGFVVGLKTKMRETILLVLWVLIPLVSMLVYSKVLTARYLLFILPYLVLVSSELLLNKKKVVNSITYVLIGIFVIQSCYINMRFITKIETAPLPQGERSGYLEEWSAGGGIKESADILIDKSMTSDKPIVVGTEGYFGTLPDGLQIYLNSYSQINVFGIGLNLNEVPQSLVDSFNSGNETYLLINSTRILIKNPEDFGLELVAEFPKPVRMVGSTNYEKFGPYESLYLFKLVGEK